MHLSIGVAACIVANLLRPVQRRYSLLRATVSSLNQLVVASVYDVHLCSVKQGNYIV